MKSNQPAAPAPQNSPMMPVLRKHAGQRHFTWYVGARPVTLPLANVALATALRRAGAPA